MSGRDALRSSQCRSSCTRPGPLLFSDTGQPHPSGELPVRAGLFFIPPPPRLLFSSEELTVGGVVVGAVSYGASLLQCSRGVGVDGHSILAEVPVHVALVVCIWSVCRSSQVHFRSRFTLSGEDNRVNVLLDEHVRVGDGVGRHCIGSRQGEEDLGHYLD